jgi:hypothetical protein
MFNTQIDVRPIEWYLEHADELAQKVVDAWGLNIQPDEPPSFTDDFKGLFDKAYRYRQATRQADERRQSNTLSQADVTDEKAARQAFAEAYKAF